MSLFTSLFGGTSTKTMPQDPRLEGMLNGLYNTKISGGAGARYDKRLLGDITSGNDVSSMGIFNTLRQQYGSQREGINRGYGEGGNALIMAAGGEQGNLLNRQREIALERNRMSEGMATGAGLSDLYNTTSDRFQSNRLQRKGMELGARQAAAGGQLGYYNSRYRLAQQPGLLNTLANMAQGAGSVMTGAGMGGH